MMSLGPLWEPHQSKCLVAGAKVNCMALACAFQNLCHFNFNFNYILIIAHLNCGETVRPWEHPPRIWKSLHDKPCEFQCGRLTDWWNDWNWNSFNNHWPLESWGKSERDRDREKERDRERDTQVSVPSPEPKSFQSAWSPTQLDHM